MDSSSILIVDDDNDVRSALTELLEDEGYAVTEASNGRAALDLIQEGLRPSLILLDLMMPGMNGWDFRSVQMRDPDLAAVPVVVVSAAGLSSESIRTQLGPIEMVPKPIHPATLLDVIQRLTTPDARGATRHRRVTPTA